MAATSFQRLLGLVLCSSIAGACSSGGPPAELGSLGAASVEQKVETLVQLAEKGGPVDLPGLRRLAGDPSPSVRSAVARLAGTREDPGSMEVLGRLAADPEVAVRRAAVAALIEARSPSADALLVASYPRQGMHGRETVLAGLARRGEDPEEAIRGEAEVLWERNLQAMETGGVAELVAVLEELGRSGREEAVVRLQGLLEASSNRVVLASARGLGASRAPAAREALIRLLASEVPARREAAAEALGELGDPAAIAPLAVLASGGGGEALVAARALVRLEGGREAACEAAMEAIHPVAAEVLARHAVAEGATCPSEPLLARLGGGPALPAAARVAAIFRVDAHLEPLLALSEDVAAPHGHRVAALEAIRAFPGAEVSRRVEAAFQALLGAWNEGREAWIEGPAWEENRWELVEQVPLEAELLFAKTAEVLLDRRGGRPLEPLRGLVRDPSPNVRRVAILGGGLGVPELLAAAKGDRSWDVREAAVEALGRVEGEDARDALIALGREGSPEIRRACIAALEARSDGKALVELFRLRGEPEVGAAAARLGEVQAAKALLQDAEVLPVTASWVQALASIRGEEAIRAAHRHLHHERPEIRAAAARTLGSRCAEGSLPLLRALASSDYYVEVRVAAREASEAIPSRCSAAR